MYIILNFSKSTLINKLLENEKLPNANTHLNRFLRKYNFRSRNVLSPLPFQLQTHQEPIHPPEKRNV